MTYCSFVLVACVASRIGISIEGFAIPFTTRLILTVDDRRPESRSGSRKREGPTIAVNRRLSKLKVHR